MGSIERQMTLGSGWMLFFKLCERGIGTVSTIVLARILVPADFGLVAMAMSFIAMVDLLRAFSFDLVLIQKQQAGDAEFDTIWTLNLIFALFIVACLGVLAHPVAAFYGDPRVEPVIYVLALGMAIGGFENVGVVMFRKELQFDRDFVFMVAKKLAGFVVCIPLAFALRSYWALIGGILASNVGSVVLSYVLHPYRPGFSLRAARGLIGFSKWFFFNNLLNCFHNRGSDFIVAKISGAHALGIFAVAFEIAHLPTWEMVQAINRAVFPGFAKASESIERLGALYLGTTASIALFAIPAGAGLMLVADLVVPIFLGPNWAEAVVVMEIFAVSGALKSFKSNVAYVFLALGRPWILTAIDAVQLALLLPLLVLTTLEWGILGAASAQCFVVGVATLVSFVVVARVLALPQSSIVAALWRPVVASLAMALACLAVKAKFPEHDQLGTFAGELAVLVCVGMAVYAAVLFALWHLSGSPKGPERMIFDRLGGMLATAWKRH